MSAALPTGTVTFLFTDIEGSTDLLRRLGTETFDQVLTVHARILRAAIRAGRGHEVRVEGDSLFVAFQSAPDAIAVAVAAQRSLAAERFPAGAEVRVRMGLHTGEGRAASAEAGADYVGIDVHRAARIAAAGHGGQVLLSETTRSLAREALPDGVTTRDLGIHHLKDFADPERIHQLVIEGLRADYPPIRTPDRSRNNLPVQLTTFIGRRQVAEAAALVGDGARLLTLTGPGGTGKTRLSIEIAGELIDRFPDGVYWVPLAPIADPGLVAPTIASSLGLHDSGDRRPILERIIEHLRAKTALLVIDNFEQLLPAAPLVGDLLRAVPELSIIASSRAPLRVYGEREFPVPPLTLPDPGSGPEAVTQSEAARLFVERALAVRPDFRVTPENAAAITEICVRVDGLPLAIELAAARVKVLSPQAIAARLGRTLDMLSGGARDVPDRQRTLRGAIAWSYDLLDPPSRLLFQRFAVFVGGADLDEIEAVCGPAEELGGDVLDLLGQLIDHSLMRQRDVSGTPRSQMLVTIREYALDRLDASGESESMARRHAERYTVLLETISPDIFGPRQRDTLDRLERDQVNIRAAGEWSVAHDTSLALRLLCAGWRFWQMRGHLQEGRAYADRALALDAAGIAPAILAKALEAAAGIAYWQGDLDAAAAWYGRTLAMWREAGDRSEIANALYNLSFALVLTELGRMDVERGQEVLDEALAIYRSLDERRGIANVLFALTNLNGSAGRFDEARANADEAVGVYRDLGDRFGLGWALHMRGLGQAYAGDFDGARGSFGEALRLFHTAGDLSAITLMLSDFALVAMHDGDTERAVRLTGAADALQERSGANLVQTSTAFTAAHALGIVYPSAADLEGHRDAREEGRRLDADAAVAYALEGV